MPPDTGTEWFGLISGPALARANMDVPIGKRPRRLLRISQAISLIRNELDVSMALTGTKNVRDIDRRVLVDGERNSPVW